MAKRSPAPGKKPSALIAAAAAARLAEKIDARGMDFETSDPVRLAAYISSIMSFLDQHFPLKP